MLHSVLEQDQRHLSIILIILSKSFLDVLLHVGRVHEIVFSVFVTDTLREVTEDKGFGVLFLKVGIHIDTTFEGRFCGLVTDFSEDIEMSPRDQSITVDTHALVEPELGDFLNIGEILWGGEEDTREQPG
jgi:hypothetical protein